MTLSLPHDSAWLDVELEVNNTLRDHRLQVELPTGVHQATHFADQPFGLIERENIPRTLAVWQQENWTEAPASLWPMQSLVMMHHAQRGLGVVTAGMRVRIGAKTRPARIQVASSRRAPLLHRLPEGRALPVVHRHHGKVERVTTGNL